MNRTPFFLSIITILIINQRGSCEIDFLINNDEEIIPIKVKAEINPEIYF